MMVLKVAKNKGFALSLEDTFFEKPQGGRIFLCVITKEIGERNSEFFFSLLNLQFFDIESVFASL